MVVRLPVHIELLFEGGKREVRDWDGEYRWLRIRETGPEKLISARVDPNDAFVLDASWPNNARSVESHPWPALKWFTRLVTWAQQVLYFYSGIA